MKEFKLNITNEKEINNLLACEVLLIGGVRFVKESKVNDILNQWKKKHISDPKLEYDDNKTAGEVAEKHGVLVGELGCPKCGCTVHGAILENECGWCGSKYFKV